MQPEILALIPVFLQAVLLAAFLVLSVRLLRENGQSLTAVFFTFCLSLWMLTDLYWIIYDLLRPESRMPFAANEIGEAAIFLLQAAVLSSAISLRFSASRPQAVGALLFAACNIALWVAWSGEWLQDVFIGAAFAYYLTTVSCSLKEHGALSAREWTALGLSCALLIFGQVMTFLLPEGMKKAADLCCCLLLSAGIVRWGAKVLSALRRKAEPGALLCLSFALTAWAVTAKYMCEGLWYSLFLTAETLSLPLLYLSVKKVVEAA